MQEAVNYVQIAKDVMYFLTPFMVWAGTIIALKADVRNLKEWMQTISEEMKTSNKNISIMFEGHGRHDERLKSIEKEVDKWRG